MIIMCLVANAMDYLISKITFGTKISLEMRKKLINAEVKTLASEYHKGEHCLNPDVTCNAEI